jgi:transcriptional regulator with XRE-family HTH domain
MQAKTLKERRLELGLSQEGIARLMEVSLFTWARWERANQINKIRDMERLEQIENNQKKA